MKKFISKFWKDIIYLIVIITLSVCTCVLFVTKDNNSNMKDIYGITIETNSGVVKSYHIETQDRYDYVLKNISIIEANDLIKEITYSIEHNGRDRLYTVKMLEYDGDVNTYELSWDCVYHIEYK